MKNNFMFTKHMNMNNYDFINRNANEKYADELKTRHKELFMLIKDKIAASRPLNQTFYSFIDLAATDTFLFIADTKTFARTIDGEFKRLFADNYNESFTIIPACVASKEKHYMTTRSVHHFKDVEDEFKLGEEVLVTHWNQDLCGAKGKVVGHNAGQVKVEILEEPRYNKEKVKKIISLLSTKADINFSLRFTAEILMMKFDHLESFLGNINIVTPSNSKLPPSIDIGLNLISRREQKLVPNLVRVNFQDNNESKRTNPFRYLELSVRALEILIEYKTKFPEIFTFMDERRQKIIARSKQTGARIEWDEPIYAEQIYPENSAKGIMKIYKWLVEMEETHMPASSLYSKQVQPQENSKAEGNLPFLTRQRKT